MHKISLVLLSVLLLACLTACGQEESEPQETGLANPMVSYSSLEEINEKLDINIQRPGVMGISDEAFYIISETLGQYDFKINSTAYTIRGQRSEEDISGIYTGEGTAFEQLNYGLTSYSDESFMAARFFYDGVQYVISAEINEGLEMSNFMDTVFEIETLIADSDITYLYGTYSDTYSQRATMTISCFSSNQVVLSIEWSSSAEETDCWSIVATVNDNRLEYDTLEHTKFDGTDWISVNDGVGGYFEISDDSLAWTGSAVESTVNCNFIKDTY